MDNRSGLPKPSTVARAQGEAKAPWGWMDFCSRHWDECDVASLPDARLTLTPSLWADVDVINRHVNATIREADDRAVYGIVERWDYPTSGAGDCEDFALEKRKELIAHGVPRQSLLMTVVSDENGAGHAILTLRTDRGDFVLDNRTDKIQGWRDTGYVFVKMQSEKDPNSWVRIGEPSDTPLTASGLTQ